MIGILITNSVIPLSRASGKASLPSNFVEHIRGMRANDPPRERVRATRCGRLCRALCLTTAALALIVGLIAISLWVEDRFPSDDSRQPVISLARRLVTRPIAETVSRQVGMQLRHRLETRLMT